MKSGLIINPHYAALTLIYIYIYISLISPRCGRIYIVKITSTFSNLVPVLLDYD